MLISLHSRLRHAPPARRRSPIASAVSLEVVLVRAVLAVAIRVGDDLARGGGDDAGGVVQADLVHADKDRIERPSVEPNRTGGSTGKGREGGKEGGEEEHSRSSQKRRRETRKRAQRSIIPTPRLRAPNRRRTQPYAHIARGVSRQSGRDVPPDEGGVGESDEDGSGGGGDEYVGGVEDAPDDHAEEEVGEELVHECPFEGDAGVGVLWGEEGGGAREEGELEIREGEGEGGELTMAKIPAVP